MPRSLSRRSSLAFAAVALVALASCARIRVRASFSEGWFWVSAIQPTPNDKTVDPTTPIAIEFAKDLDPETVTPSTFRLHAGDVEIPAYVTYLFEERIAVLEPKDPLAVATTYEASLTTEVRSTDGDSFPEAIAWTFKTGNTLQTTTEADTGERTTLILFDRNGHVVDRREVRIVARTR